MKQKILYFSSVITAFLFGVVITYFTMTKKQMDQLLQAQNMNVNTEKRNSEHNELLKPMDNVITQSDADNLTTQEDTLDKKISPLNTHKEQLTLNTYSQEQAKKLIDDMPNLVLEQYIDKFMARGTSEVLVDKRKFAERAIEELYGENDSQVLSGDIKLSSSYKTPMQSMDTSTLGKKQKIYAHLDTRGQVPASPFVFIKWVNNTTGQVLLFEKKDVSAQSQTNWVSFIPHEAWEVGSYDVKYYQFTSELEPIAQLTYYVNEISDEATETSPDTVEITTGTAILRGD